MGFSLSDLLGSVGEFAGGLGALSSPTVLLNQEKQDQVIQQIIDEVDNLQLPPEEATKLALGRLSQQGVLTPELEQAIVLGPSAMEGVQADAGAMASQRSALERMQQIADDPRGLDAQGRLAMAQAQEAIQAQERGSRGALQQNMASRGLGGGGMELAMAAQNQQGAAQRNALAGLAAAAQGEERRRGAVSDLGQMSSQMRGQSFGEGAARAQAMDAISRYNAANQQGVQQRNVGSRNYAQERNLGESQRIADTNVGFGNQEAMHRSSEPWRRFNAQRTKSDRKLNASGQLYNHYGNRAQAMKNLYTGIGRGVGGTVGGIGDAIISYYTGGASEMGNDNIDSSSMSNVTRGPGFAGQGPEKWDPYRYNPNSRYRYG